MSFGEIVGAVCGWAGISLVVASFFHVMRKRQPRQGAAPPPRTVPVSSDLWLTTTQLADVQTAVIGVGHGAARCMLLGFDHVTERGVGSIVIVVADGTLFDQAIAPAIMQRLAARSGT